jgi:hypothetical protein
MSGAGPSFPARGAAPLVAALALCCAAAFWVSQGVAKWDGDLHNAWHHYEYLAEGFARGHTYLSIDPDPELLALKDPYDPAANARHRLWDATLYRGRYYLYFGPAPALFMLPWRIVAGHEPAQRLVVASFAAGGLAGLALLLWGLRGRFFPGLSPMALGGILVVAFHASWLPVVLRRSAVWEVPIVAAAAFLWWAIYFVWRFHDSGGSARWAAAAGAALALIMGCRVNCLFEAGAIALLLFVPVSGAGPGRRRRWDTALLAGLVASAGGVALLAYNHARFGSWLEVGTGYQLPGVEYRTSHYFNAWNIPFNARAYLLSLPEFGPYFPFLHPYWTDDTPAGYLHMEDLYGVLFMMPVHVAGLGACAWAWANRAAAGVRAAGIALAAAACASAVSGLVLFSLGGACSRYITELVAGWTVATSVGLMAVFGPAAGARPRRLVRALAAAAACWSVACVWLASAEYQGYMRETNPRVYGALAHALDYPSYLWARREAVPFGPAVLVVHAPASAGARDTILVGSGRPESANHLVLEQAADGRARLALTLNQHHVLDTPEFPVAGGLLRVRINAPWLYPPAESPYWDAVADPAVRQRRQTLFSIESDSGAVAVYSTHFGEPVALAPAVRGPDPSAPDSPCVQYFAPSPPP